MRHTTQDLFSTRSLLINTIRNRSKVHRQGPRLTFLMFLEMPTAGHTVLGDAVATDDAVDVPKHVGLCSCPQAHTGNPHPVTRVGGNPAPAAKTTLTDTASPLKTYLKERDAAHQEGLPKESTFGQDYQDRESDFTPRLCPARDIQSYEVTIFIMLAKEHTKMFANC